MRLNQAQTKRQAFGDTKQLQHDLFNEVIDDRVPDHDFVEIVMPHGRRYRLDLYICPATRSILSYRLTLVRLH